MKDNEYGKFINILDEEKEYYHIYFNNSIGEIKSNYLKDNEKVKIIKIIINYQVRSFKELFQYCECISSLFFKIFYRYNVTYVLWIFFIRRIKYF